MNDINDNKKHIIEYKYIIGQNMIEDIKQPFLEYVQSLKTDLVFQGFETELKMLPEGILY